MYKNEPPWWNNDPATEKQLAYVRRIIDKMGMERFHTGMNNEFINIEMKDMTKGQAQKIINRFGHLTSKPIYRVAGRDVPWNVR